MRKYLMFIAFTLSLQGCTEKLDLKPDQSKVVPETLEDLQAMLDNTDAINNNIPAYTEAGADNYYLTDMRFNSLSSNGARNAYIWGDEIFTATDIILDWAGGYTRINYCNLVLESLDDLNFTPGKGAYNNIKGSALFLRAMSLYTMAEMFCKPYDSTRASSDLGLPLRTVSDILKIFPRASLKETYDRIFDDLNNAIALLPEKSVYKTRPSKLAAYALLSRIYLGLGNYGKAKIYADSTLNIYSNLLDYNTVANVSSLPFDQFNADVLFSAALTTTSLLSATNSPIDTLLYEQFEDGDLRKSLFFRENTSGMHLFKGTYSGNALLQFGGLALDEVILNRAECQARTGNVLAAMDDLNKLLRSRWLSGAYTDLTATDQTDALVKVLNERRKELIFRGRRWTDLRRLNKDVRFAKTIIRNINGKTYQLLPNGPRYVFPIPDDEIQLSGIEQNIR
ncbi:RagB/SusD family nutrient uptake outer membrane protein [Chitinophaga pinensis]|uniref:RagB/SusD family nutrient uptake outer membrane protein n=1 Tax=Chitinophaga pinensis (strain ATCC 43595 / DSM 2588 / LMG 13176 / NBRC 15968 / NCIMB 11800 / UQM 2034) TaxID=485918 RepID=A0A979G2V0_CHIPD|nr:RagB/SusD family nutrient uptake outer membrane protein [Chitinophaga pinensis]ACU59756.1 hypothetical protein Cpin_2265 [Chitinophaga pinensis DSM 2588]